MKSNENQAELDRRHSVSFHLSWVMSLPEEVNAISAVLYTAEIAGEIVKKGYEDAKSVEVFCLPILDKLAEMNHYFGDALTPRQITESLIMYAFSKVYEGAIQMDTILHLDDSLSRAYNAEAHNGKREVLERISSTISMQRKEDLQFLSSLEGGAA